MFRGIIVKLYILVLNMTTPVNFILTAMNSLFSLSSPAEIPLRQIGNSSDATIHLTYSVPATVLQKTFFYRTDNYITSDASFVYHYVDMSYWPDALMTLNPQNGTVVSNCYVADDNIGRDFIRNLAEQLFGTYLAADIFTNETDLTADISNNCDMVAGAIISLLNSIDKTTGSFTGISTDSSGNKYMDDNTSSSNICREVFNQLITSDPTRFSDIKSNWEYNAGIEDGFYKMPVVAGDDISFALAIFPAANQAIAVPTGNTTLVPRSYTIILHAV